MQLLLFYWIVKALREEYFLYGVLPRFIQNVLQSKLSHGNKTTKDCSHS